MSKPNSIAYFTGSLSTGGAERHVIMIASELVRRGYDVSIYTLMRGGVLEPTAEQAGIRLIGPRLGDISKTPGRAMRLATLLLAAPWLYAHLLFRRPQITHFFLPEAYLVGAFLARGAGLRRLLMSRRSLNNYQRKRPRLARLEHRLHDSMQAVLGNSRRVVEQLQEEGVAERKLGLIYNGIKPKPADVSIADVRQSLGLAMSTTVIAIVANLIPYKGHADLIAALAGVKAAMPEDWALLIVGRDDGIQTELERQAESSGIRQNLHFLGLRQDVPQLLAASDFGVLCSHQEGFSNALLEGMAAGLPMVATDAGGNAEAVIDRETGYIVPIKDAEKLGEAILRLATDPALAHRMGEAGREHIENHFTLGACVDRYEILYEGVFDARPIADLPGVGLERQDEAVSV